MMLLHKLLSALTLASFALAQNPSNLSWVPFDRSQFAGNAALDTNGDVQVFWKLGSEYSTYGIASRSSGYLALGFSETGAMTGADMAVGYKDPNGSFIFENRHATGFIYPQSSPDQAQNMRFREGHQSNGVSGFVFEKHNTAECLQTQTDVHVDSWQWLIYAFSDQNTFAQHEGGHMGKQYVKLGIGKTIFESSTQAIDNTKNFTLVQPEVAVPSDETTYCYSLHKMPEGAKNFLVAERPPPANPLVHYLVVYACYGLDDKYKELVDQPTDCNWQNYSNPCNGFVTEWVPGMAARTWEPGYGKPFGTDLYDYVMMEVHYNNPQGLEGEKDSASYTFLYTDEQVDTEIGTLTLGDLQVEGWFLEPGKEIVSQSTMCTPECTDKWPAEGITAVSVFHHMHYRGRNAKIQIIRDGKEILPLSSLRDFEYGYQYSKSLNEVKLLPGDKLITTCEFDTTNDTQPVPGGLPSQDEMCFAWVDYYPASSVIACTQMEQGYDPINEVNGTAAVCLSLSDRPEDVYKSDFLTAPYEHLPASGNNCTESGLNRTSETSYGSPILRTCPEQDVCFSLNVPEGTAGSGLGDIYFQLSAPIHYSWVALAQGTMMNNANMFVMYSSADGRNVTISPRTASGHSMPKFNSDMDISLLQGSGIADGKMTANVRCGSCSSWSTGTMDLKGGSTDWVYAHRQGAALDSDDQDISISQHDGHGEFQWELSQATGGSSTNPFLAASSDTTTSSSSTRASSQPRLVQAHGAVASIAFVAIFPIGAMLIRLVSFKGLVWIHAGLQIFGYVIFIAAAGIGIFVANKNDYLLEPHAVIGMLLLGLLFFMPVMGVVHHKLYNSVAMRTWWSYGHIFTGRIGIFLGMINGGLGLRLADADRSVTVAYGVLAGLVGATYFAAIVYGELQRMAQRTRSAALLMGTTKFENGR